MDLRLAGKRAIVTGGTGGIGLAIARGLLAEGARVALAGRDPERLAKSAAELRGRHPEAAVLDLPTDTTDDAAVRASVDRVGQEWDGVDVLVNGAARPASSRPVPPLAEIDDADVLRDFDTKVLGYLRCARAVAPYMIAQGGGRIVNISGLNVRRTGVTSGAIRNAGVAALTANLADELGPHGIGVVVVHPGLVENERIPHLVASRAAANGRSEAAERADIDAATSLGRLVTADEVANVVVFLASPMAAAVTGDAVGVGGGNRGSVHY
ncbi:SDR family oxidoreductase [Saccharomonospora sp. NPDC046836]|uniref:SDR family oxidoreductase n=1 Tax=Saccharomonospora sp. NPDC046836 TaxID=3156921 RepID=UPI0033F44B9C